MLATDGWGIAESLGSVVSGAVLVGGAVVAGFYGQKANPSLATSTYVHTDGRMVLVVKPSITSAGVRPIKIAEANDKVHAPLVVVTEVLASTADHPSEGLEYQRTVGGIAGRINGGETVTATELFYLEPPDAALMGWLVQFYVSVRRFPTSWRWWDWNVSSFQPVPSSTDQS